MNAPLIVSGSLGILGAAIHGVAGEILVVRRLSPEILPSTSFGDGRTTKSMIHAAWHLTTIGFLTVGSALLLAGSVLDGDTARGMALLGAGASTAFALLVVGLGLASARSPRLLVRHPAPALLTAAAALAWWGALAL